MKMFIKFENFLLFVAKLVMIRHLPSMIITWLNYPDTEERVFLVVLS